MSTYNGWTNYATWRVNLEMFDQLELGDFWGFEDIGPEDVNDDLLYDLSSALKEYAEEIISEEGNGLAVSYALAFISDVNWREIAKHMLDECLSNQEA